MPDIDYERLIFLINAGLEGLVKGDLAFPVAEELPRLPVDDVFTFRRYNVNPTIPYLVSQDETCRIKLYTADVDTTLVITLRLLRPDGELIRIRRTVASNTASGVNTEDFRLNNGQLVSLVVEEPTVVSTFRACYVEALIIRGGASENVVVGAFARGYVRYGAPLIWPGNRNESFADGPGAVHTDTYGGGGPVDLTYTMGPRSMFGLVATKINLTCSATVASRRMVFIIDDGSNQLWRWVSPATQAASSTIFYEFAPGTVTDPGTAVGTVAVSIPRFRLLAGWRVRTAVINLQIDDNLTATPLVFDEWQLPGV